MQVMHFCFSFPSYEMGLTASSHLQKSRKVLWRKGNLKLVGLFIIFAGNGRLIRFINTQTLLISVFSLFLRKAHISILHIICFIKQFLNRKKYYLPCRFFINPLEFN